MNEIINEFLDTQPSYLESLEWEAKTWRAPTTIPIKERIRQFKLVHGDRYEYSLCIEDTNRNKKVPIICSVHGVFHQTINCHLGGSGCPKCASPTESNVLYVWQGVGTQLFKVGVTCVTQKQRRIRRVATIHGLEPNVWVYTEVPNPKGIEKKLHTELLMYRAKGLPPLDGHTEFFELPPKVMLGVLEKFSLV